MNIASFDIETGPNPDIKFDSSYVKLGNLVDQEKIDAKIEAARNGFDDMKPLHASTGVILLVCIKHKGRYEDLAGKEDFILDIAWKRLTKLRDEGAPLCGHNIMKFDLPFMLKRSWLLGVNFPHWVYNRRYGRWDEIFFDTMLQWELGNRQGYIGLSDLDKKLGGPGVEGGKGFHELAAKDPKAAIEYCHRDLDAVERISARLLGWDLKR